MNNQEKQALSQALATKYGIYAYINMLIKEGDVSQIFPKTYSKKLWLHEDWARLMPLAVEQEVSFSHGVNGSITCWTKDKVLDDEVVDNGVRVSVDCKDHPTKEEAVRIAICRALIEKE